MAGRCRSPHQAPLGAHMINEPRQLPPISTPHYLCLGVIVCSWQGQQGSDSQQVPNMSRGGRRQGRDIDTEPPTTLPPTGTFYSKTKPLTLCLAATRRGNWGDPPALFLGAIHTVTLAGRPWVPNQGDRSWHPGSLLCWVPVPEAQSPHPDWDSRL